MAGSRPAAGSRIALRNVPGDGVDTGAGVPLQGADGSMPGAGQQHRRGRAVFGVVRQGTVAESVKRPAVQVPDVFR